jgi:hypothetical protein
MFEGAVAEPSIDVHLRIEEGEAFARAVKAVSITDKRMKAPVDQALDQFAVLCP